MVLVTGGTGLLGRTIIDELLKNTGYRIRVLTRYPEKYPERASERIELFRGDLADRNAYGPMVEGVSRVVHAAALMSFWRRDHAKMYETNVEGTRRLVDACLRVKMKKFVYVGAMATVGPPADSAIRVVNEDTAAARKKTGVQYAETKKIAERIVESAARVGLPAVILVPPMIIGPGNWDQSSASVFALMYRGMPVYMNAKVPVVAAVDVARAVRLSLEKDCIPGEKFFLVADTMSARELFEKIARSVGKPAPRVRLPRWLVLAASFINELPSLVTWKKPGVTVEGVRMISDNPVYRFDGGKICASWGLSYTPIDEVIAETGKKFLEELYQAKKI